MPEAKEDQMADLTEKMARNIAVALNGGEFNDGKWYGEGHRTAWRNAVRPYAEEIEGLRAALMEFTEVMSVLSYRVGITVEEVAEILNPVGDAARAALNSKG